MGGRFITKNKSCDEKAAEKNSVNLRGLVSDGWETLTRMGKETASSCDHSTRHVISVLYHVIVMLSSNARKKYI